MQKPTLPWAMILRAQSGSLKPHLHHPGQRYQVCKRDGCNQKNIDETYAAAHPALGHVWGKYVNDNKPACEQQTETAHCTREGCTATDTENLRNFGSDGNPCRISIQTTR